MFTLNWTFRNTHKWCQSFDNLDSLLVFINTCGLVSHPDIINIYYVDGNGVNKVLKEK